VTFVAAVSTLYFQQLKTLSILETTMVKREWKEETVVLPEVETARGEDEAVVAAGGEKLVEESG
jgi:hypothetical protein